MKTSQSQLWEKTSSDPIISMTQIDFPTLSSFFFLWWARSKSCLTAAGQGSEHVRKWGLWWCTNLFKRYTITIGPETSLHYMSFLGDFLFCASNLESFTFERHLLAKEKVDKIITWKFFARTCKFLVKMLFLFTKTHI